MKVCVARMIIKIVHAADTAISNFSFLLSNFNPCCSCFQKTVDERAKFWYNRFVYPYGNSQKGLSE